MDQEFSPRSVYTSIIDQLVKESVLPADRLQNGIYSKAPDHGKFNNFIATLNSEQRTLLAEMLNSEHIDAVHGVLATLTWWIVCHDVTWNYKGEEMPVDISGMGLHGDYVGRLADWEWPEPD